MNATAAAPLDHAAPGRASAIVATPISPAHQMADAIRVLMIDPAQQHLSALAGWPTAMAASSSLATAIADVATALWTRYHKFDAADPSWPDRDRFVLSAGRASPLLHALLSLTGHATGSADALRDRHASASPAVWHSEYASHPAVETTFGPPGQGLAIAVGMAIAERNMAARFGKSLVDHRTWVIASDADLMQGISHEAASLAGHLGLAKLTVMYHETRRPIDADTACSDNVLKRFSAQGWATKQLDGHDPGQINAALSFAVRSRKPTLIACRSQIADPFATGAKPTPEAWSPLRPPESPPPTQPPTQSSPTQSPPTQAPPTRPPLWHLIPAEVTQRWHAAGSRGASARRSWLKRLARHNQRGEFDRVMSGRLPETWHEAVASLKQAITERTAPDHRVSGQSCLDVLVTATPELIGGGAGQTAADLTLARGMAPIAVGNYGGRYIHYGPRQHAMAAAANGMALHGGIIPCIGTSLALSDYFRPALRMSAIMHQRVVYVLTYDPTGEDDPAHPSVEPLAVEHLAALRAMPSLHVYRPGDGLETAESWELALRRSDGPSLLVLPRQALPAGRSDATENRCARGGYVLAEAAGPRHATIIATGSELPIALAARDRLAGYNIAAAVVSLPCWELFALQDSAYRAQVLGAAPRVAVEAAGPFGWDQWLGPDGTFIGTQGFAATGHPPPCAHSGITADAVVAAITRRLG